MDRKFAEATAPMTGATGSTAGVKGLVPAPGAGDEDKVLSGAGTWVPMSGGSSIDLSVIAPGYVEGSSYNRGQLVHRDGKLYRALGPVSDDSWVAEHWAEVRVSDVVPSVIQSRSVDEASFTSSMAAMEDGDSVTVAFVPESGGMGELVAGSAFNARKIVPANAGKTLAVNRDGTGMELTPVLPEAPADGATYGMKNGEWKAVNVQIKTEEASEIVFTRTGSDSIGKTDIYKGETESVPFIMGGGPATYFFSQGSRTYVMTSSANTGNTSIVSLYGTEKRITVTGFTDNTGTGIHYYNGYFYYCSRTSTNVKVTRFADDLSSTSDYSIVGNSHIFHHSSLIDDSLYCGDSVTGDIYRFNLNTLQFTKVYTAASSDIGYLELSKHVENGTTYYLMSRGPTIAVFSENFELLSSSKDVLTSDYTRVKVSSNVWLSNKGYFLTINVDGTYKVSSKVSGYSSSYEIRQGLYDNSGKLKYVVANSSTYNSFEVYLYNPSNTLTFIGSYDTLLTYNVALTSSYLTYVQAQADLHDLDETSPAFIRNVPDALRGEAKQLVFNPDQFQVEETEDQVQISVVSGYSTSVVITPQTTSSGEVEAHVPNNAIVTLSDVGISKLDRLIVSKSGETEILNARVYTSLTPDVVMFGDTDVGPILLPYAQSTASYKLPKLYDLNDFGYSMVGYPRNKVCGSIVVGSASYPYVRIGSFYVMSVSIQYPIGTVGTDYYRPDTCDGNGYLYKWDTLFNANGTYKDALASIVPSGWRVPTSGDVNALISYLGTTSDTFYGLRSEKYGSNYKGTNIYGFSGIPYGYYLNGILSAAGQVSDFWTSTAATSSMAYWFGLPDANKQLLLATEPKTDGFQLRLIKDV